LDNLFFGKSGFLDLIFLPPLSSDRSIYPASLEGGTFALANRKMDVFSSNIA
jgi:hypothetical protein